MARNSSPSAASPLAIAAAIKAVGAIDAIIAGQRQKAVGGQQQRRAGHHLHHPARDMRGGARIRAEQPIVAAVDAVAGGAQGADEFRAAEAGSRRQVFLFGDRAGPLRFAARLSKVSPTTVTAASPCFSKRSAITEPEKFHAAVIARHRQHHGGARRLPHLFRRMTAQALRSSSAHPPAPARSALRAPSPSRKCAISRRAPNCAIQAASLGPGIRPSPRGVAPSITSAAPRHGRRHLHWAWRDRPAGRDPEAQMSWRPARSPP